MKHFFSYQIVFYWQCLTISPEFSGSVCACITACPYNFIKHKYVHLLYSSPCHLKYLAQIYYAAYVFFWTYDFNRAQQWPLTFALAQFPKASLPFFFSTGISKLFNNQPVPREILQITLHYELWSDATRYLKTGKNKDVSKNMKKTIVFY